MYPYELNARHQLDREGNFPGKPAHLGWMLDKLAEEKLTGGYSDKRNPICPNCMIRRSNSGSCMCD